MSSATILDVASIMSNDTITMTSFADIAAHVLRFLDKERAEFAKVIKEGCHFIKPSLYNTYYATHLFKSKEADMAF